MAKIHSARTVAELRAIFEVRKPYCLAIKQAMMRGDLAACEAAQNAMRNAFPDVEQT